MSTINTAFTFTNGVPTSVVAIVGNKHYEANSSHSNWKVILDAIKEGDVERFVKAIDIRQAVADYTVGNVKIVGNEVFYGSTRLHGVVVDRLFDFMRNGLPFEPIMKFIGKLFLNPSSRAVNELYTFLEHKNLPITSDGNFRAYKGLRSDFYSRTAGVLTLISGKVNDDGYIYNGVGEVIECLRHQVNDNKDETCSYGLHAGSLDYAKDFAGGDGKFVIVEINPSDVVSIPSDCSGKKLRTCKYVVVEEYIAPLNDTYINTMVNTPDEYVADDGGDDDLCQCDTCKEERGEYVADDGGDDLCQCDGCKADRFADESLGFSYGEEDGKKGIYNSESAFTAASSGIHVNKSFFVKGYDAGVKSKTITQNPNYHNKRDASGRFTKA